eukprot:gene5748-4109_t
MELMVWGRGASAYLLLGVRYIYMYGITKGYTLSYEETNKNRMMFRGYALVLMHTTAFTGPPSTAGVASFTNSASLQSIHKPIESNGQQKKGKIQNNTTSNTTTFLFLSPFITTATLSLYLFGISKFFFSEYSPEQMEKKGVSIDHINALRETRTTTTTTTKKKEFLFCKFPYLLHSANSLAQLLFYHLAERSISKQRHQPTRDAKRLRLYQMGGNDFGHFHCWIRIAFSSRWIRVTH